MQAIFFGEEKNLNDVLNQPLTSNEILEIRDTWR